MKRQERMRGKKETKRRRSGGEVLEWLKEKGEIVQEMKEQEVQERREESGQAQRSQNELFMAQMQAQSGQMNIF